MKGSGVMKKTVIVFAMIFVLLLGGCKAQTWEHTVDLPPSRPDDFAIYYEWGYSSNNYLDTFNGKISKDLITAGKAEGEIKVSEEMLDRIYFALKRYDIASIPVEVNSENCAAPGQGTVYMTPCAHYVIRFRADGKEYAVRGDDTGEGYPQSEEFFDFVFFMTVLVESTPEYQAFPEAVGGYC